MSRRSSLALILAAGSWGLGTVISKRAVEEIPPLSLLAIQLGASIGVLVVLDRLRPATAPTTAIPRGLGALGLLNPGLAYALSLLGLSSITASMSVLLWTAEPILILLLAAAVLGERVGGRIVALSAAAAAGMVLVVYEPGSGGSVAGVALTLAGVACCAVYSVLARRWLGSDEAAVRVVVVQQAWALALALCALVVVAAAGQAIVPPGVSAVAWASALASGVIYYGAAYWSYLTALRELPASIAAASFYLIPVFGVGGAVALLGEGLAPAQWVGAGVVVVAVALILTRATRPLMRTA